MGTQFNKELTMTQVVDLLTKGKQERLRDLKRRMVVSSMQC